MAVGLTAVTPPAPAQSVDTKVGAGWGVVFFLFTIYFYYFKLSVYVCMP